MKRSERRRARDRADDLFSRLVRRRGFCEACGRRDQLECAHILSRRHESVRVDLDNALCLCRGCHRRFTDDPPAFERFVRSVRGERHIELLWAKARAGRKVVWPAEADRLRELLKRQDRAVSRTPVGTHRGGGR